MRGTVSPLVLAMLYQYLEGVNDGLCSLLHGMREIRKKLVSMQKVLKLKDIPQEFPTIKNDGPEEIVPKEWPTDGRITFEKVSMCYQPGTTLRLTDLSLEV